MWNKRQCMWAAAKFSFLHVRACWSAGLMKDSPSSCFPVFMVITWTQCRSAAAVLDARKTFSPSPPELTVSVPAPPLRYSPCLCVCRQAACLSVTASSSQLFCWNTEAYMALMLQCFLFTDVLLNTFLLHHKNCVLIVIQFTRFTAALIQITNVKICKIQNHQVSIILH